MSNTKQRKDKPTKEDLDVKSPNTFVQLARKMIKLLSEQQAKCRKCSVKGYFKVYSGTAGYSSTLTEKRNCTKCK